MADPLADQSRFLSSDPDALVVFAKWFGKVDNGVVASAQMVGITTTVRECSEISYISDALLTRDRYF
jgi:hypothetical protein